jgi:excisionase family DNA binding protein
MGDAAEQIHYEPHTLTVDEVAALLRVERKAIYAAVQRREIPGAFRVGRLLRFKRAVVIAWLAESHDPPRARRA